MLFKFIPADVGRPITDLASELIYPQLTDDAHAVLHSLVSVDKIVATRGGRWLSLRVMPYRSLDDRIEGVVLTFMDLSHCRKLETLLKARATAGMDLPP